MSRAWFSVAIDVGLESAGELARGLAAEPVGLGAFGRHAAA